MRSTKERFGREMPLSDEARAALGAVAPQAGLIFGERLPRAAKEGGNSDPAASKGGDLRRLRVAARPSHAVAETGNLTGLAHLAGHRNARSTHRYLHPTRAAAKRALAAVGPTGFKAQKQNPTSASSRLMGSANSMIPNLCEGEDSNLHGSYPASTSS